MPSISALSTRTNSRQALTELLDTASPKLAGRRAPLACLFGTINHALELGELAREIRTQGLADHVIGVTAESIAGGDVEVENSSALSLWILDLPGVNIEPVRICYEDGLFLGWQEPPVGVDESSRALILLADPFSFPADEFVSRLNDRRKGFRVMGGMASAAQNAGQNKLVIDDDEYRTGAVGVIVSGDLTICTVVSQGCRPIGRHQLVTKAERNIIRELGRRPALEVLQEIFDDLEGPDQERVRRGLHLGRVINEYQDHFGPGDFLVRNVLGGEPSGAIAVNDNLRVGQTVQFHVRDAATADEDLRGLLANSASTPEDLSPDAALLFTCNGRGSRLFEMPNHDMATIHEILGPVPTAGFFAMGEIGPIGSQNFIHGFTASIGLFYAKSAKTLT
jgi:small ligand-binding sensory domain FIST